MRLPKSIKGIAQSFSSSAAHPEEETQEEKDARKQKPPFKDSPSGMVIFRFFKHHSAISMQRIAAYACIAGLSNAAILGVINTAAENASSEGPSNLRYMLMFLVILAIYNISQRYIFIITTNEVENIIHAYRGRIVDLVRHCDLDAIESIGKPFIFAATTRQPQVISQTAGPTVLALQSLILIFFIMIYMAILSMWAFYVTIGVMGLSILLYQRKMGETNKDLHDAAEKENVLFEGLTDVVDGFKEVRIHTKRSNALAAFIESISSEVTKIKVRVDVHLSVLFVFAQTAFYVLAATLVFVLPMAGEAYSEELLKTVTVVLFLMGPISSVVGASNNLAAANAACEDMIKLETNLIEAAREDPFHGNERPAVKEIQLENVSYSFKDRNDQVVFTMGPSDLTVKSGELLFISGGNGSGKSTLMKLLVGLYKPQTGRILLDGKPVSNDNLEDYQSLYTTIFFDFHLFPRTFGIHADPDRVQELLDDMEIGDKTKLVDGKFDTLKLSTGQRKRLAMVVSMLEDRPVYMFDEWAADQDPEFRQKFYEVLLPKLKAEGKTIIAVTHDDRYFGHCDRRIVMEEGKIVDIMEGEQ